MKKIVLALLITTTLAAPAQAALSLKTMKEAGSAIKWRDSDRDSRMTDIDNYIMNVAVPSGDIDFGGIEGCAQGKLSAFKDVQVMDKKGPSFHEIMSKCVF